MTEVLSGRGSTCVDSDVFFDGRTWFDGPLHVVVLSGDLDLASRNETVRTCLSPDHVDVTVDMAGLEFMDCAGYGALVTVRTLLERRGGSLTLINPCGEPLRLLSLIGHGESSSEVGERPG